MSDVLTATAPFGALAIWVLCGVWAFVATVRYAGRLKAFDLIFLPIFMSVGAVSLLLVLLGLVQDKGWLDKTLWESKRK